MEEYKRTNSRNHPVRRTDYRRRLPRDTQELEREQRLYFQAAVSFILVVISLGLVFLKTDSTISFREKLKVGITQQVSLEGLRQNGYIDAIVTNVEGFFAELFPEKGEKQDEKTTNGKGVVDAIGAPDTKTNGEQMKGQTEKSPVAEETLQEPKQTSAPVGKQTIEEESAKLELDGYPTTIPEALNGNRTNIAAAAGKNQEPPETTLPES